MKSLIINRYGRFPKIVQRQIPKRLPNQHLIKMAYASINPSDLNFFQGVYGIKPQLPTPMGFEGSGIIIDSDDKNLVGTKVSVAILQNFKNFGTFGSHVLTTRENLVFWPDSIDLKQISCSSINPLTVLCFKNLITEQKFRSVLLSASASTLGKMALKYFKKSSIRVNSIVRNPNQIELLKSLGASNVFVDPLDQESLALLSRQEKTVFFDCVGGQFAGTVFNSLPQNSKMINYGRLSKQNLSNIQVTELLFKNKKIEGLWISRLFRDYPEELKSKIKTELVENFEYFKSPIRKCYILQNFLEAFKESIKDTSQGKILLNFE